MFEKERQDKGGTKLHPDGGVASQVVIRVTSKK